MCFEFTDPLIDAVMDGDTLSVRHLATPGLDLNAVTDEDGRPLLHIAAANGDHPMIALLLELGLNKNLRDAEDHCTALFPAMLHGRLDTFRRLLHLGVDPNVEITDGPGRAPYRLSTLMHACLAGKSDFVAALVPFCSPDHINQVDGGYKSALLYAIDAGSLDCVRTLVQASAWIDGGPDWWSTPLCEAIRDMKTAIVAYLLEQGANPALPDPVAGTPLQVLDTYWKVNRFEATKIRKLLTPPASPPSFEPRRKKGRKKK